jgi:hypothetical protein
MAGAVAGLSAREANRLKRRAKHQHHKGSGAASGPSSVSLPSGQARAEGPSF